MRSMIVTRRSMAVARCATGASTSMPSVSSPSSLSRVSLSRRRSRAMSSSSRSTRDVIATSFSSDDARDLRLERAGPSSPTPPRRDGPLERVFLRAFTDVMRRELDGDAAEPSAGTFDETRDACLRLVRESGDARETRERGLRILRNCAPSWFPRAFGVFLSLFPSWFAARHAAAVTPRVLPWLVGDAEVNDVPVDGSVALDDVREVSTSVLAAVTKAPRAPAGYKQGVLLKRCRVLEETGCAAVCANVCKHPTQKFFTEEIGLPVTLTPNYETFECQFSFGATPPDPADDVAFSTPCFRQCPASETLGDESCGNLKDC